MSYDHYHNAPPPGEAFVDEIQDALDGLIAYRRRAREMSEASSAAYRAAMTAIRANTKSKEFEALKLKLDMCAQEEAAFRKAEGGAPQLFKDFIDAKNEILDRCETRQVKAISHMIDTTLAFHKCEEDRLYPAMVFAKLIARREFVAGYR